MSHHTEEQVAKAFATAPGILRKLTAAGVRLPSFELFSDGSGRLFLGTADLSDAQLRLAFELIGSERLRWVDGEAQIEFCCGLAIAGERETSVAQLADGEPSRYIHVVAPPRSVEEAVTVLGAELTKEPVPFLACRQRDLALCLRVFGDEKVFRVAKLYAESDAVGEGHGGPGEYTRQMYEAEKHAIQTGDIATPYSLTGKIGYLGELGIDFCLLLLPENSTHA